VLVPADDELVPGDMDWEQLLAATFDPADGMLLGPDEMFSLNRNDVLYAQKYAAARSATSVAPPTDHAPHREHSPPTEHALLDDDLERCANDLDRFVNDLELACSNIGQLGSDVCVNDDIGVEQPDRDLDLSTDHSGGHTDNLDTRRKSPPSSVTVGNHDLNHDSAQDDLDMDEGHGDPGDDLEDDLETERFLQTSDEILDTREDSTKEDDSERRRVLSDLDPGDLDLEVNNGPTIALREMTSDLAAVRRYPYDPDPEATVV